MGGERQVSTSQPIRSGGMTAHEAAMLGGTEAEDMRISVCESTDGDLLLVHGRVLCFWFWFRVQGRVPGFQGIGSRV